MRAAGRVTETPFAAAERTRPHMNKMRGRLDGRRGTLDKVALPA